MKIRSTIQQLSKWWVVSGVIRLPGYQGIRLQHRKASCGDIKISGYQSAVLRTPYGGHLTVEKTYLCCAFILITWHPDTHCLVTWYPDNHLPINHSPINQLTYLFSDFKFDPIDIDTYTIIFSGYYGLLSCILALENNQVDNPQRDCCGTAFD